MAARHTRDRDGGKISSIRWEYILQSHKFLGAVPDWCAFCVCTVCVKTCTVLLDPGLDSEEGSLVCLQQHGHGTQKGVPWGLSNCLHTARDLRRTGEVSYIPFNSCIEEEGNETGTSCNRREKKAVSMAWPEDTGSSHHASFLSCSGAGQCLDERFRGVQ